MFARDEVLNPYFAVGIDAAGEGHLDSQGKCDAGTACAFYFVPWEAIQARYNLILDPRTTP